jgi:hypothetical protein
VIDDSVLQKDLVADLLAYTTLTGLLASATEIREDQYQGTVFHYPAVRVAILNQTYIPDREQCDHALVAFSVRCYTEEASSKAADILAGVVNGRLHRRNFHGTGWYSWFRSQGLVGALRVDERLWRAEALFGGTVYPTSHP